MRRSILLLAFAIPALALLLLAAHSSVDLVAVDVTVLGLLIAARWPRAIGLATVFVLASVPFAAVGIDGYNVPLVLMLAPFAAGTAWVARLGIRARLSATGRVTLAVGAFFLITGSLSFMATQGTNGVADMTDYLQWIAAASAFLIPLGYGADWSRLAAKVFSVGAAIGGLFAVATVWLPHGPQLLEALGNLGYVRTGNDARYFIAGTVNVSLRASGSYTDPNIAGIFFVLGLAASTLLPRRWYRVAIQLTLCVSLFATLSRGAFLGGAVAVLAILIFARVPASRRAVAAGLLVSCVVVIFAVPVVHDRVLGTLSDGDLGSAARLSAIADFDSVMTGHWEVGVGYGRPEFRDSTAAYAVNVVADAPLASVYRAGLLGGAGFILWYLWCLLIGARSLRANDRAQRAVGAALLAFCVTALTGYSTALTPEVVLVFSIWLAFAVSIRCSADEKPVSDASLEATDIAALAVCAHPVAHLDPKRGTSAPRWVQHQPRYVVAAHDRHADDN